MAKICFVCLGNICRSPTAEGVMRGLLQERDLMGSVEVESAGTSGFHVGEPPDARAAAAGAARGIIVEGRAQHFTRADFARFDLVVAMDATNRSDLLRLAQTSDERAKVRLFLDFSSSHAGEDVPDPYYGGARGFERVLDLCTEACGGLLDYLDSTRVTRT